MAVTAFTLSSMMVLAVVRIARPQVTAQTGLRTEGRRFLVYPSRVDSLWDRVHLHVTTRSVTPVTVQIRTPKKPTYLGGVALSRQVAAGRPLVEEVRTTASPLSQDKLQDGLLVTCLKADVSVFVSNPSSRSSGMTSILTHSSLASTYLVPSINRTADAQMSILLGNPEGVNEVRVTLPGEGRGRGAGEGGPTLHWKNTDYGPGQSFSIMLHQYEFADIRQSDGGSGDLTGTLIHGLGPLAVFCAAVFYPSPTGLAPPFSLDRGITIENVPPLSSWGRRFVVRATPFRSDGDYVRVLAAQNDVHVQLGTNASQVTLTRKGHYTETQLSANQAFLIQADKPVLVMQYRLQFTADSAPFMFLVPAVDDYDVSYNVPVIFDLTPETGSENHVILMTHACYADRVLLKHDPDPQGHSSGRVSTLSSWKRVEGSDYMVTEVRVGRGVVSISMMTSDDPEEDRRVTVGGYVFGKGNIKAYATPLGLRSAPSSQVWHWPLPVVDHNSLAEPTKEGKSVMVSRDKVPLTLPLTTQTVRSKASCHHQCWIHPACFFVAYPGQPSPADNATAGHPHTGTVPCQLLGPTAGCSGLVSRPGELLYRLDKV
ncbi:uncharacterized protein LOC143300567 isoform X2 [Babylonia areolata]|uniref:uncharacterized protein LOC143300567 isoform X2 n=1 Tax=Babylonia areolata TaxID=304850 RepID=UPI003FD1BC60